MVDWQIDANRPRRVPRSSLTWVRVMHVIKLLHALHNITGPDSIYMLLQSGMFHYMLGQLHAYYMIFHAFTIDSMQLQALHANPSTTSGYQNRVTH